MAESAYGKGDIHVLRPLTQYARWLEHMDRYATARALYARSLAIAEQTAGQDSLLTVEPLQGIARTYRLEFVNGAEDETTAAAGDPFAPGADFAPTGMNTQRLNPDGERALQIALQSIDKAQPVDHLRRGATLVELGEWYLCSGVPTKALQTYHDAWKDLSAGGSTALLSSPRQIAYRAPSAAITRTHLTERDNVEEHFVEVTFTVTKDGRTTDVNTTSTDAPESQQRAVLAAVKKARYAPRFENGEPADTSNVHLKERLVVKK